MSEGDGTVAAHESTGRGTPLAARGLASGPRVVFAGGGSGGHLVPGIHVARAIQHGHPDAEFLFLRGSKRVESLVLDRAPGATRRLTGLKTPRGLAGKALFSARLPELVGRSIQVLRQFRASAVIGLGGYGAVPVVLAGRALGLRLVLLEQNVKPGLANRMLAPMAHAVCCAFSTTTNEFPNGLATGNPVGMDFGSMNRREAARRFGFDADRLTLMVVGGSQGAQGLNRLVCRNLGALTPLADQLQILHVSGETDRAEVAAGYRRFGLKARVESFVPDMSVAYRAVDVVMSRAGGTTMAELALAGLPVVFVPYPHHRDRHQYANARVFVEAGAGFVLAEDEVSASSFGRTVGALLRDPDLRMAMSRAANRLARPRAAECVAAFVTGHGDLDHRETGFSETIQPEGVNP